MKPISFIQPSRNNLKYLKWSYNSIRKNLGYIHEICWADDFSNDGTWEWMNEVAKKDRNVKIHRNEGPTRLGHTILYDTLINEYATSDIVMIYHADMYACPKLDEEVLKHLEPGKVVSATRIEPPLHPDGPEKILEDFGIEPEEFDELSLNKRKPLVGTLRGSAFAENYTPSKDIAGNYLTRRKYGAMATFDEASKVVTGLQLLQAGIIDKQTMQREMDGLEDLQAINERITKDKAESVMFDSLLAQASQGESKAQMALVDIYNKPNSMGTILKKFFTAEEPEMSPQEQAMAQMAGAGGPPPQPGGGQPPSPEEVLGLINQGALQQAPLGGQ